MTFKQFIKKKRLAAGLTQQQAAAALGLRDRAAFLKLENDNYPHGWSLAHLQLFSAALGVTAPALLAEWEDM